MNEWKKYELKWIKMVLFNKKNDITYKDIGYNWYLL